MNERGSKLLKILDFYLGIPLIFILGFFRFKKKLPQQIKTIGILKTAAIGDTVLLTAVIKDLRIAYPQAKIILLTGSSNYSFARLINLCDEVLRLPIKNIFEALRILRKNSFDVFLDFGAWPKINSLYSYMSKSKCTIGFKTTGQYRHYVYDVSVSHSDSIHELENYRNIIRRIGMQPSHLPFVPTDTEKVSYPKQKYIICHALAGGENSFLKELPTEKWIEVCRFLLEKGYVVVFTGATDDISKNDQIIQSIQHKLQNKYSSQLIENRAGLSLSGTISLLKNAEAVISVNTGVMHIASAMNLPTIGIHGPTSVLRWGPLGKKSISVVSKNPQCQYLNLGFEFQPHIDCMVDVSVQDIKDAFENLSSPNNNLSQKSVF